MLRELSETLGGRWLSHEAKVFGLRAAEAGIARTHALSREEPFDEDLAFPDLDEKVRTRLGEDGSLKYECVYLSEFATGAQARTGIGWWMDFYNRRRPHSALNDRTPAEAYTDDGADTSPGLCPGSRQPKVA